MCYHQVVPMMNMHGFVINLEHAAALFNCKDSFQNSSLTACEGLLSVSQQYQLGLKKRMGKSRMTKDMGSQTNFPVVRLG